MFCFERAFLVTDMTPKTGDAVNLFLILKWQRAGTWAVNLFLVLVSHFEMTGRLGHRWQRNALVSSGQISHWATGTLQPALEIRKLQPQLQLQLRKSTFCFLWLFTTKRGKWFYPPPIYPSHISKHAAPPVSVPYFVKQMSIMSEVTICLVKNWVTSALHHSFLQYLNELTLTDIDSHSIADAE